MGRLKDITSREKRYSANLLYDLSTNLEIAKTSNNKIATENMDKMRR